MPRDYGKVSTAIFTDPKSKRWSDFTFRLATYLLAGPHANAIGCFYLPFGYVKADICNGRRNPSATVKKGFQELSDTAWATYCERTEWVWIPKFLLHNQFENPNVAKAALSVLKAVPADVSFYDEMADSISTYGRWTFDKEDLLGTVRETFVTRSTNRYRNHPGTIPEPMPNPEPEPKPEPEILACVRGNGRIDFDLFKDAYPERSGSNPWPKAVSAATARIKGGYSFDQLVDGARRYKRFCDATGKTGTELVMQAQRFLGPGLEFTNDWELPDTRSQNEKVADNLIQKIKDGRA